MVGVTSWYSRRRHGRPAEVADPSAWTIHGPTSDNSSGSTTVVVTAAASRVTESKVKRASDQPDERQTEAQNMYRQVGELRYVANAIAGRCAQAELFVELSGERQEAPDKDPILSLISGQMTERLALNLFVAGDGYIAGLPADPAKSKPAPDGSQITAEAGTESGGTIWMALAKTEVKQAQGKVTIRGVEYAAGDVYLERAWDPDPFDWEMADSPVLSAIPVLRQLVGLTQSLSAQIDSRLAGAGVYWIPNNILSQGRVAAGSDSPQTNYSENAVLNAIMNGMLVPIEDRSSAASVVPLLLGAPGDDIEKIRFDSFATPFDENTEKLTDLSIRRLALNMDAPPELLLGMGDSNHWASWLVRDEVVQVHVAPRLALVTDAYTVGLYRPILRQMQESDPGSLLGWQRDADPDEVEVKADVSGLVQRPNRLADASQLHAVNVVSDKALRAAGGFEESDAPSSDERAAAVALSVATANPQLIDNMAEIAGYVKALLDGSPASGEDAGPVSQREPGSLTPLEPQNAGEPPAPAAKAAPNGTPVPATNGKAAPLAEADSLPRAGSPV